MKIIKIFLEDLFWALVLSTFASIYVIIFLVFSVVIMLGVPTVFSWIFLEQETYLYFVKLWSLTFSVYVFKFVLIMLTFGCIWFSLTTMFDGTKKLIFKK
ncbi:hypothetical protein N9R78_01580 [Pelagibacteraceae bacterium]|nr:hypothetical protein [Pelagibacteraceae bacterium]